MDNIFQNLEVYEASLPIFTHEELSRIDFSSIDSFDYISLEKIVRSLLRLALVYEQSVEERFESWLVATSRKQIDTLRLTHVGCLSTNNVFSILYDYHYQSDADADKGIKAVLISKTIKSYISDSPNFCAYYLLSESALQKIDYWETLIVDTFNSDSKSESFVQPHSLLSQYIPDDSTILSLHLNELFGSSTKNKRSQKTTTPPTIPIGTIGTNQNFYTLSSPQIMSIILQISYAYLSLLEKSKGSIQAPRIRAEDIMLIKTKKDFVTYSGKGIVKTYGIIALIVNYDEWEGYITIGNKMYPSSEEGNMESRSEVSAGPLVDFIDSILSNMGTLRSFKRITKNNNKLVELFETLTDISDRLNKVTARSSVSQELEESKKYQNQDLQLLTETGITVDIIIEELSSLPSFDKVWRSNKNISASSSSNIYHLSESLGKLTEDWMHIRAAYSRTSSVSILNAAVSSIQKYQNEYYKMAVSAGKALANKSIKRGKLLIAGPSLRPDLVIDALLSLDLFASLWRIANYLIPDDPAVVAMKEFVQNNWDFEDDGLINYIDDDEIRHVVENRILDMTE